jgi:hypothetical protein
LQPSQLSILLTEDPHFLLYQSGFQDSPWWDL